MPPGGKGRSRGQRGHLGGWDDSGWGVREWGGAGQRSGRRITAQRRGPWAVAIVVRVLLVLLRRGGAEASLHVINVLVQQGEDRLRLWFPKLLLQGEGLDG